MYTGHMRQSRKTLNTILMDRPSRLCMSDFDGSSLRTRFTMTTSSLTKYRQHYSDGNYSIAGRNVTVQ